MANQLTEPSQTHDPPLTTTMVIVPPSPVFACALTVLFALMALANVALGVEPRLTSIVHVELASTFAETMPYLYRDTECSYYFALMLQMTFSVLLSYREIPFIMMQSTQSDVGVFTAIWTGWGLS